MKTVGETLIQTLAANDVEMVFGIPGIHTCELYRGLAGSAIRHITPRHEQAAGFMADGYARVSGKPGVCLVISGPGLTNTLTAMAQAQADSIPMIVISGVNARSTLNHGRGMLHELPDQRALIKSLVKHTHTMLDPNDIVPVINHAFALLQSSRPGVVHIEIPTDLMSASTDSPVTDCGRGAQVRSDAATIDAAIARCLAAKEPVILVGGGAKLAAQGIQTLAEYLDSPVITTINARGILGGHPLCVPASPSLQAVRDLLASSDCVLAIGTELGATDFDIYAKGHNIEFAKLIRIDIDASQLCRGPTPTIRILSSAVHAVNDMLAARPEEQLIQTKNGQSRADHAKQRAWEEIGSTAQQQIAILDIIRKNLPNCIIVGDSTQPVYSGNLYCDIEQVGGWFNSATGFGTLGFGPPAAIGAQLAKPDTPVICIVGDGGIQFTLAELGTAIDEKTPVIFLVWNNQGYSAIENYMLESNITPVGVNISPPDFKTLSAAFKLGYDFIENASMLKIALEKALTSDSPTLIEIDENRFDYASLTVQNSLQ